MRRLFAYFSRPGRFVFLVAAIVFGCAALLWNAMRAMPEYAGAPSGSSAAVKDRAIARALIDMVGLAFEEPLEQPLEEGVKQADFALVQALLRTGIPPERAVVEKTELRQASAGAYHYQRIAVAVGSDPLPFLTNFHDSLKAWAESAEFSRADEEGGNAVWTVSVLGVTTHELVLLEGREKIGSGFSGTEEHEGPGRVLRRRAPGEPARLVIVIDDIGEDMGALRTLLGLPYPVTCAVWPRSTHARKAAEAAHAAGREVIIHQPSEPMRYPEMNPGKGALFISLSDAAIEGLVRDSLKRVPYAVGMNNHMGSRFTRDERGAVAMVRPLRDAGFFVLDSVTHPGSVLYKKALAAGVPALKRDVFLDADPSREAVLRQLRKAERIARVAGRAIAIGHPLPETLSALKEWGNTRDLRVSVVTLTHLLETP